MGGLIKAFTHSLLGLICVSVSLFGCSYSSDNSGLDFPVYLASYQRSEPTYFSIHIEEDGQVSRAIQSGTTSETMVPVERDSFMLSEEQFTELEQLIEPEQVSLYLQDQGSTRTTTIIIESNDVSEYIYINEDQANSDDTQRLLSFFKSLGSAQTEVE